MTYIKQNFIDGEVLEAEQLNKIEEQIIANENALNERAMIGHGHMSYQIKYPTLSDNQKNQIQSLIGDYINASINNGIFIYNYNATRNSYANTRCWMETESRFALCCNTFIEMVWMGRSVNDFVGKNASTYSNEITKCFDWGYYFNFEKRKKLAGVAYRTDVNDPLKVTNFSKVVLPRGANEDNKFKFAYSVNTRWAEKSDMPYNQRFMAFLGAASCAEELYKMGCEIPFSELDVGDIIFTKPLGESSDELYDFNNSLSFRNISHVAIICDKLDDGTLFIAECTDSYNANNPVNKVSVSYSSVYDKLQAERLLGNVVMCARHPSAWGKSNMNNVTKIDYVLMAFQDGYENNPIPVNVDTNGMMIPTVVKKDKFYIYNSEIGTAIADTTAKSFDSEYFIDIKTNKPR